MLDILDDLIAGWRRGETVGVATVVSTFSSAPRLPGSTMLVTADGAIVGSVSGGCIDGAVYEQCRDAIGTRGSELLEFGVSDESAIAVGLTCGGTIDVFVHTVSRQTFPELENVYTDVQAGRPVAVATVIAHPDHRFLARHMVIRPDSVMGGVGDAAVDRSIETAGRAALSAARSAVVEMGVNGDCRADDVKVFVTSVVPAPRMIVFGANDFAGSLIEHAKLLGYRITLCDARPLFATPARFPLADEVVVDWPHRYLRAEIDAGRVDQRTALCVLTHDPKFDIPLLACALRDSPAGYIGAMGSRRTHDQRLADLGELGIGEDQIARLSSPIGLDLGGCTPQETALSILAELVMLIRGGTGSRLSRSNGRIHPAQPIRL